MSMGKGGFPPAGQPPVKRYVVAPPPVKWRVETNTKPPTVISEHDTEKEAMEAAEALERTANPG